MTEKMKVHYSSASNEWGTPQALFEVLDKYYHFTLDPCATKENHKCKKYYTIEDNGLSKDWGEEVVFMNPPYSRGEQSKWIKKAWESSKKGAIVVCLIPSRTETKWFYDYCSHATGIIFLVGRVKFLQNGKPTSSAPFPSCIIIFAGNNLNLNQKICWKRQFEL